MISYDEFLKIVGPLIAKFKIRENMAESLKIDYENLRFQDAEVLKEAVNYVLETHWGQEYPTFAELLEAVELSYERRNKSENDIKCWACLDSGFAFDPIREVAYFCCCEAGIRKRAAEKELRKGSEYRQVRKAYDSADISKARKAKPIWERAGGYIKLRYFWEDKLQEKLERQIRNKK